VSKKLEARVAQLEARIARLEQDAADLRFQLGSIGRPTIVPIPTDAAAGYHPITTSQGLAGAQVSQTHSTLAPEPWWFKDRPPKVESAPPRPPTLNENALREAAKPTTVGDVHGILAKHDEELLAAIKRKGPVQ